MRRISPTVPILLPSHKQSTDPAIETFKKATILCTLASLPSDPKLVPNLKFIHFFSAGIDHVRSTPIYKDTVIPLTTSSGIHGPQISEWVIMQMLSFAHKEKLLLELQKEHKWGKHSEFGQLKDYVGQRLGVLGYGSIGRQSTSPSLSPLQC
jgi:phosphoglycerate dehydrogenase-like enzyme